MSERRGSHYPAFHHCFLSPKRYTGHELKLLVIPERYLNIAEAYGKICVALLGS